MVGSSYIDFYFPYRKTGLGINSGGFIKDSGVYPLQKAIFRYSKVYNPQNFIGGFYRTRPDSKPGVSGIRGIHMMAALTKVSEFAAELGTPLPHWSHRPAMATLIRST